MLEEKLTKAIYSIERAKDNYFKGDKLSAKCDLDYAKENIEESIHLLFAELGEEGLLDKIK